MCFKFRFFLFPSIARNIFPPSIVTNNAINIIPPDLQSFRLSAAAVESVYSLVYFDAVELQYVVQQYPCLLRSCAVIDTRLAQ